MALLYNDMRWEERNNLAKFDGDYRTYMEKVPRMNIVAVVFRIVRRRAGMGVQSNKTHQSNVLLKNLCSRAWEVGSRFPEGE